MADPELEVSEVSETTMANIEEVHPDPANALSDAATQWPLERAEELLAQVQRIYEAIR